jgi:hypothetical protein
MNKKGERKDVAKEGILKRCIPEYESIGILKVN